LSIEQFSFLLCGFNPHSLDGDCFNDFKLGDDGLLSKYITQKTTVGRSLVKDFDFKVNIPVEKLIRWASSRGFIYNENNRVLSKELTISLHSLLMKNLLIKKCETQHLWNWLESDVLLAYLIASLVDNEIIPSYHQWKIMESYIAQKGIKRLSQINDYKYNKPNGYKLIDSIIKELKNI